MSLKDHEFLKGGLFDKDFMQTKIRTFAMTGKEKFLGYFLGPCGVVMLAAAVNDLKELYFTSVMPVDQLFGSGTYLSITTTAAVVAVITGLLLAYVVEHTNSKAGRIRPYILIGSVLMIICGWAIFNCPFEKGSSAHLIWLWASNILYTAFAIVCWNVRYQKLGLSSRNIREREQVTTFYSLTETLITGVLMGFLIGSILYYSILAKDMTGRSWSLVVNIFVIIAIPLMFVEYYFTRERVTEDNRDTLMNKEGEVEKFPLGYQLKALLTNKYYLISLILIIINLATQQLQGTNIRTNYCQWVLGANEQNQLQTLYMAIGMSPMGFGIPIAYAIMRKIGARKTVIWGGIIMCLGYLPCVLFMKSVPLAFVGSFLSCIGQIPITYMARLFEQEASDAIEYEYRFRPEGGLGLGIIAAVYTALLSPLNGMYEHVLVKAGYDATLATQNDNVIRWIVFVWCGALMIRGICWAIGLSFFDIDDKSEKIRTELKERRKAAVEARGEVWVDEEEKARLEQEESDRLAEEYRIKDLKEKCVKKGLDFDTENQKYLDKLAQKKAKEEAKKAKKEKKQK